MNIIRYFDWNDGKDSQYGTHGWLPSWISGSANFDPSQGLGVAHDFFEHRLSDQGLWREEVMAFGAMVYTRLEGGYFSRGRTQECQLVGEELGGLWADAYHQGATPSVDWIPARSRPLTGEDERFERDFRMIAESIYDGVEERLNMDDMTSDHLPDDHVDIAISLLRAGFIAARSRYKHANRVYNLSSCFQELENTVNKLTPNDELYGWRMRVCFDPHDGALDVCLRESGASWSRAL